MTTVAPPIKKRKAKGGYAEVHDDKAITGCPYAVAELATMCLQCGGEMIPEGAHYSCSRCRWRDSCCF